MKKIKYHPKSKYAVRVLTVLIIILSTKTQRPIVPPTSAMIFIKN